MAVGSSQGEGKIPHSLDSGSRFVSHTESLRSTKALDPLMTSLRYWFEPPKVAELRAGAAAAMAAPVNTELWRHEGRNGMVFQGKTKQIFGSACSTCSCMLPSMILIFLDVLWVGL